MTDVCRIRPETADDDGDLEKILRMRVVAVVGCSPKPARASHYVAAYLKDSGYRVVPVNPGHDEILGERCYPNLSAIPFAVELVDVFRRPSEVRPIIEEAIAIGAKALWLQDGITDPEGEARARSKGLLVVSDDCIMRVLARRR